MSGRRRLSPSCSFRRLKAIISLHGAERDLLAGEGGGVSVSRLHLVHRLCRVATLVEEKVSNIFHDRL